MYSLGDKQKGFTLVEILVVIVIIGVVITAAILALGSFNDNRKIRMEVDHLRYVINSAKNQAILMPQTLGLVIDTKGYQFFVYQPDRKGHFKWKKLRNDALSATHAFNSRIRVRLIKLRSEPLNISLENNKKKMIIFSGSGEVTPFTLVLANRKQTVRYQLKVDESALLTWRNLSSRHK